MSKDKSVAVRESGAHSFNGGKNHDKPAHQHGPVETGKHEKPARESGAHTNTAKPLVHTEQVGVTHSGRPLPEETKLADSKIITSAGRLAKRNDNCETANL
jgi:hypothetical protein